MLRDVPDFVRSNASAVRWNTLEVHQTGLPVLHPARVGVRVTEGDAVVRYLAAGVRSGLWSPVKKTTVAATAWPLPP